MSSLFEARGTQRVKRGHEAASSFLPNGAVQQHPPGKLRRKRNNSSSRGPATEDRPCRRLSSSLAFALCVIVISGYGGMALSRNLSERAAGATSGSRYSYSEKQRLRREVESLEASVMKKKALLGIKPDTPISDGGTVGVQTSAGEGGWAALRPYVNPAYINIGQNGEQAANSSPAQQPRSPQQLMAVRRRVAGEPLFGVNPVRESLNSKDSLLREPVPLIVGGTDGSGTRSVVALLQHLRVPMVVEDGGTMDVHGSPYMVKGGWPAVVRPVLDWAHGAEYDPQRAPRGLRSSTIEALGNLRHKMEASAKKIRKPDGQGANHVTWGFKAPVSMILVPFFAEAWGKAKFLHVVRDGRDIAFSGNQTPVQKFYGETFPQGSRASELTEDPLKAIAMWNSWNVGLYDWAASREADGATGLDYLLLHTEDLIDPAAKFAAIKDVAEFVGSPLSDKDLCCIATEASKDMGSHTTVHKERGSITSRFGKWKGKVEGKPELSKRLHEEGGPGLEVFGYEPERSLRASDGFQCPEERDPSCPKFSTASGWKSVSRPVAAARKNTKVPERIEDTESCVGLTSQMDFKGFDLLLVFTIALRGIKQRSDNSDSNYLLKVGNTEEHLECCQECRKAHGCTHFTFDYKNGNCYLKSGKGQASSKEGLVSGSVLLPP